MTNNKIYVRISRYVCYVYINCCCSFSLSLRYNGQWDGNFFFLSLLLSFSLFCFLFIIIMLLDGLVTSITENEFFSLSLARLLALYVLFLFDINSRKKEKSRIYNDTKVDFWEWQAVRFNLCPKDNCAMMKFW